MKNIFRLENITLTVDGTPVELNGLTIENESSVQEIATSGGLIKQLVQELKPLIQAATTTAPARVRVTPIAEPPADMIRVARVSEPTPVKVCETPETPSTEPKSLAKAFNEIKIPESMALKGYKTWEWKDTPKLATRMVNVSATDINHIMITIMSGDTWVYVHIRPNNTKINGVAPEEFKDFLEFCELPDEIREYLEKVIAI